MGGGRIQLIAIGEQDLYLTGNPEITFFKNVYRKHTNFSMELIQQNISNNILSLPMNPYLDSEQINHVLEVFKKVD